jgi:hypothetical protein
LGREVSIRVIAVIIGASVSLVSISIMYAGSDQPPPAGFIVIVFACLGLGAVMGGLVPVLHSGRAHHGTRRALAISTSVAGAYLTACAGLLVFLHPERTAAPDVLIFLVIALVVGALGGLCCGLATLALLRCAKVSASP